MVHIRRSRSISFRVSENEYRELEAACQREGAHSLSAFTRTAVSRYLRAGVNEAGIPGGFETSVKELSRAVDELSRVIGTRGRRTANCVIPRPPQEGAA